MKASPLFAFAAALCASALIAVASETPETPLAWRRYEAPGFPDNLATSPLMDGSAVVLFTVDAAGRVQDAVTTAATHPSFGDAVLAVTRDWELEPVAAPASWPRREVLRFVFRRHGMITSLTHRDAAKAAFSPSIDDASAVVSVRWEALAAPPERLATAAPVYPEALKPRRLSGSATVGFVIDEEGRVRVPVAVAATDPAFAEAAVRAVQQWRFSPPRQRGRPVVVGALRTFAFRPAGSPASP